MQQRIPLILLALLLTLWGAFAWTRTTLPAEETIARPVVTTSIYPLAYLVERIAGDLVEVHNVTPSGAEPHDYEPTPNDMRKMEEGKILLLAGGGLEPWADTFTPPAGVQQVTLKPLLEGTLPEGMITEDPHFWLSPVIMQEASRIVTAALSEAFPEHRESFTAREASLLLELNTLEAAYATGLATCTTRDLVTSHDAFGYLARAYGLETIAIAGVSPEAEPSPKDLAEVAHLVNDRQIKVIFFERLVSPKFSETIARETGARTMVLDPIEGLDAEGADAGADYFSIMRENLEHLKEALSCTTTL